MLEPAGAFNDTHEKWKSAGKIRDFLQCHMTDGSVIFKDEEGRIGLLFSWAQKDEFDVLLRKLRDSYALPATIGVGRPSSYLCEVYSSKCARNLKNSDECPFSGGNRRSPQCRKSA